MRMNVIVWGLWMAWAHRAICVQTELIRFFISSDIGVNLVKWPGNSL